LSLQPLLCLLQLLLLHQHLHPTQVNFGTQPGDLLLQNGLDVASTRQLSLDKATAAVATAVAAVLAAGAAAVAAAVAAVAVMAALRDKNKACRPVMQYPCFATPAFKSLLLEPCF